MSADSFLPVTVRRSAIRYTDGGREPFEDVVASEYALTIFVNQQEMATIVCTPEHLEELILGFLASEGVIRRVDQVLDLRIVESQGVARVTLANQHNFNQAFYNKRYISSCCGKSRQSFYFYNDAHTVQSAPDTGLRLEPEDVIRAMNVLQHASDVFRDTGGVHTAMLFDVSADTHLVRSDIGRHNALDKLFGHQLRAGDNTDAKRRLIAFSGRLSSEVLLKAAKIGVGVIVAKAAPTAMALDMADELNITAIGFARGRNFTVYTHAWRMADES